MALRACNLYRQRAIFSNFALQTQNAVVGLALSSPMVELELPPECEYLRKQTTPNGLTIDQTNQTGLKHQIRLGRVGVFTDFPQNKLPSDEITADKTAGLQPRIHLFPAKSVINWKTRVIDGVEQLSLVVICKNVEVPNSDDKFVCKTEERFLVLELDDNGVYFQSEKKRTDASLNKGSTDVSPINEEEYTVDPFPVKSNGKLMRKIPFDFAGSENNDPDVDTSPLASIVWLNIGHLNNSAQYEDNLFRYARGIMSLTTSHSIKDMKAIMGSRPFIFGSDEMYNLGTQGGFQITQLQPAVAAADAMEQKQRQIVMLGGHIVKENPSNVSERTTELNMGERVSTLETIVGNWEDVMVKHIGYCADFLGANKNLIKFKMSRDFVKAVENPAVMAQLLAQVNAGALPRTKMWDYDKKVGLLPADINYDELQAELDTENPTPTDDVDFNLPEINNNDNTQ
jgi:hypothetical protein